MRRIDLFQRGVPIVDAQGRPTMQFQANWQQTIDNIYASIDAVAAAQVAANAAQTAADTATTAAAAADAAAANAQAATDETKAETSLVNSYPANPVGTLITADNSGAVTIADHDRVYGDPALNPTVPVDGDTIATGEAPGTIVRIYYSDPTRAGGAVTYQYTADPAPPPVQGGNVHSVGAVEIPAGGPVDGSQVQPPGWVQVN